MLSLGLDVCTGACSAALVDGERVLASLSEPMTRGHVERLAPMVEEVLVQSGAKSADLDVISVTTGPGSFTGARLGVAFARGFALACAARPVGVSVFEALAARIAEPVVVIAIDGRRDDLFLQRFDGGIAPHEPYAAGHREGWRIMEGLTQFSLAGSGADCLLAHAPEDSRGAARRVSADYERVDAAVVAKLGIGAGSKPKPAPLYLRAPDSKPQAVTRPGIQ